jgi:uncharacterized membrane protein YccC
MLFISAVAESNSKQADRAHADRRAEQARAIAALELAPETVATRDPNRIRLAGPPLPELLARAISPGSRTRHVMLRVAIAGPAAGTLAMVLGLGHPYWAMSTAVLLLHQGIDHTKTLRRSMELLIGTWLGLVLAGGVLMLHPQGLWLAVILALFQFTITMLAPRNYTVAAIFIAATALTISSGTHPVAIGPLLMARGVDVLVGCVVAIPVYLATAHFQESTRVTDAIGRTIDATADVVPYLADGDMSALAARAARRNLQMAAITLKESDEAAQAGSRRHRSRAAEMEPAVAATERLAYRTIAAAWTLEHRSDPTDFARELFGNHPADDQVRALRELATAARAGTAPTSTSEPAAFMAEEMARLRLALRTDS